MIVVADASPLRYLILIEYVDVLAALYGRVVVPPAVITELTRQRSPDAVRTWLSNKPAWLDIQAPTQTLTSLRGVLGEGEREAIALAGELSADALLVDDRDAREEARELGVRCSVPCGFSWTRHPLRCLHLSEHRRRVTVSTLPTIT